VLNVTNIWMGLAGITVVMVAARIYQQLFAFSKGVDSSNSRSRTWR